MIKKQNNKWYIYDEDGKKLGGPYDSLADAEQRLSQIEYFKHNNRSIFSNVIKKGD